MQWSSSSSERLSRPGSAGLLKWKVAWNTISTKTPRIPPKIRPHMPAEAHPVTFLLHRFSLVTSLFELALFSCQPLVISEAICLYLEMSTSHLTTPSDPSVKLLWCICVITTARQLRFYCKTEQKSPELGPFSISSVHKETYNSPVWEKGLRLKYLYLWLYPGFLRQVPVKRGVEICEPATENPKREQKNPLQ